MMKQMKQLATQSLFGAQEIKAYMKRATLTSFGLTMGLFTSAVAVGMWIASYNNVIIDKLPPVMSGGGTTIIETYGPNLDDINLGGAINIDVLTTIIQGTQQIAGNFIPVPDMSISIDADDIASVGDMGKASSKLGDTSFDDIKDEIDIVFGDPKDFNVTTEQMPVAENQEFNEWEVSELPNVDISEISSNIVYPRIAKQAGIEGLVLLNVLIGPDGKIAKIKVEHSDNLLLNEAAISAVKKSTFTPAIQDSKPCSCWMSIPIEFMLD